MPHPKTNFNSLAKLPEMPPPPLVYNVGDKVEVIGREKGFVGSYFEATIVSALDDGRYEVKYENLMQDGKPRAHLKEKVPAKDLRPRPPRVEPGGVFESDQSVDVFTNGGWWKGMIIGEMDKERSVYCVNFTKPKNEYHEFRSSRIRAHHEFLSGRWFQMP
ncbi:protein AGENET DOMAIN (AGD)-CONTAINING P1-like [Lotus japonicus]|uniref:protein AGENET DOMAIN (AGD)-CONTAINING P1-like n=1 Tax=Lotus japonicus TaxID=34305 RepID=UPI00258A4442|nr:protein AGENET DOMAIN (AGD)-CONTAINING P1-like [Lotus japonicus]